jgi:tRNA threonylcarbamoyladenosine biosynthesis protein TsaB
MIDARRMEVYNAVFDSYLEPVRDTVAEIIDENSLEEFLLKGKVAFFGDGAAKCKETITHPNAVFYDIVHSSVTGLAEPAIEKFQNKVFEDVAYFEPFYLKDFVAGKPRVKGLD